LLFHGGRGALLRRNEFYKAAWHPALKAAGLWIEDEDGGGPGEGRFVFHSLRHFCASSLLAEGAPLAAVAGHLGDTVDTVSRTYVHWLRDDRDVPAAVLDRVLAPGEESQDGRVARV
jgi:integrase